ncbi:MAG: cell division protein [Rhodospirillales bacterium]|jgi:cell division transport system permease protein|nr:cell division protein [Rhodospirillales bacterium]
MFAKRTDLPLDRDALSQYLPWLIAFMVYMAVLALAGLLVLGALARHWDTDVSGTMTVQIPPTGSAADDDKRVRAAIVLLLGEPAIVHAEAITEGRLMALLEPWLGSAEVSADLPLPRLVDVEIEPEADLDMAGLARRLDDAVPGATLDDHRIWLDRLVRLVRSVEALAALVLALMGSATVGTVVFTTRTGLAIHRDVIEVLHLIGAHDGYIARQFAQRALTLGLRGGLIGLALAVPTLLAIGSLARRMEAGIMPNLTLAPSHWLAVVSLPLLAAAIAMLTARLTVTRTLARMP